jgi:hypothetical protein
MKPVNKNSDHFKRSEGLDGYLGKKDARNRPDGQNVDSIQLAKV